MKSKSILAHAFLKWSYCIYIFLLIIIVPVEGALAGLDRV